MTLVLTPRVVLQETEDPKDRADLILTRFVPLGQRFYPSECAFPLSVFLPSLHVIL